MSANPEKIIQTMRTLTTELDRIANALYDAEVKMIDAEHEYDTAYSKAYLIAGGNIPDRQATAKEQTRELELASEYARAEYNRLKLKMRTLSDQITITAVVAKQVELIWKHP